MHVHARLQAKKQEDATTSGQFRTTAIAMRADSVLRTNYSHDAACVLRRRLSRRRKARTPRRIVCMTGETR